MRRSLIPHFGLTFSQRDSVELENQDIDLLLLDPERFEAAFRIKSNTEAGTRKDKYSKDMFDD